MQAVFYARRKEVAAIQEEIENRTVNLAISTTRLTWRAIVTGYRAYKQQETKVKTIEKQQEEERANPKGKQTVKQLIAKDQGVTSVPIGSTGIKDFEHIARKYGVDYAIMKDKSEATPRYLCFFKAMDGDALDAAMKEYSARMLDRETHPSMLKKLRGLVELAKQIPAKVRHRQQEHDR